MNGIPTAEPVPGSLAAPAAGEVHVWWTPAVDAPGGIGEADRERLLADLDAETRARLDRMRRSADRLRGLLAHGLLRRLLAATLGGQPQDIRLEARCVSCGSNEHGKRRLVVNGSVPLEFNLSHAGEVVAVALAPPGTPVGIDVEALRPVEWPTLRRNVFGDEEWMATASSPDPSHARFQVWARKEAAVKATGHGLSLPLSGVNPHPHGDRWSVRLPQDAGAVTGQDVETLPGHVGAVAIQRRTGPPRVTLRRAELRLQPVTKRAGRVQP